MLYRKQALLQILPEAVKPSQGALCIAAVIYITRMRSPANFDENGWLTVGFTGKQIIISESSINTGIVYLCTMGLLPLGLPSNHPFWSETIYGMDES